MQDHMPFEGDTPPRLWAGHIIPFVAWLTIMALPFPASPLKYGLQSLATLIALFLLKPWRLYTAVSLSLRHWIWGAIVGVVVAALWIVPETSWMASQWPAVHEFYLRYAIRALNEIPASPVTLSLWNPHTAGWTGALIRLGGSALVIAIAEEFFWRGFLMRWIAKRSWASLPFSAVSMIALLISAIIFGLEHDRWVAGILAGIFYGGLCRHTNSLLPALVAHGITNALLGIYVLTFNAYGFW